MALDMAPVLPTFVAAPKKDSSQRISREKSGQQLESLQPANLGSSSAGSKKVAPESDSSDWSEDTEGSLPYL